VDLCPDWFNDVGNSLAYSKLAELESCNKESGGSTEIRIENTLMNKIIISRTVPAKFTTTNSMKRAIVIGATSGMGRGLARLLANENYNVGITGRRTNLLDELKRENPDRFVSLTFDMTDISAISTYMNELTKALGGLDLLIICSGTGDINEKLDFWIEKKTIDVNVTGFTALCDWAFHYFEQQQHGQLVAITSIAGLIGSRHAPAYNATKSYQIKYLEGLQQKAKKAKLPLSISDIRPGFVDTAMAKGDGLFWVASIDKAVQQLYRAIKRKRKITYITKRWSIVALLFRLLSH